MDRVKINHYLRIMTEEEVQMSREEIELSYDLATNITYMVQDFLNKKNVSPMVFFKINELLGANYFAVPLLNHLLNNTVKETNNEHIECVLELSKESIISSIRDQMIGKAIQEDCKASYEDYYG